MAPMFRSTSNRIEILSDSGEAKIRELCPVVTIYEDIRLDTRHFWAKRGPLPSTYPFQIAMNHVAGVKKEKAFSNITQLEVGVSA